MITKAILDAATAVMVWLTGLFPKWTLPAWLTGFDTNVNAVMDALGGISPWVDWQLLFVMVGGSLTVFLVCFVIKTVLKVAAFLPLVGGSG